MPIFAQHPTYIDQMIETAVAAVDPYQATFKSIEVTPDTVVVSGNHFDITQGRVFVVAIGKAAVPMAHAAVDRLGSDLITGIAVSKKGQTTTVPHPRVQTLFAAHPVPDHSSVEAAEAIIDLLADTAADDLILFLISGGASALCTKPLIPLNEWQTLSHALLASGCPIQAFNTVRKQLDQVKGGGLGELATPAHMMTLVLSDVIGNPIDMIGSGPTVPNPQSPADALAILTRYNISHPAAESHLNSCPKQPRHTTFRPPTPLWVIYRLPPKRPPTKRPS